MASSSNKRSIDDLELEECCRSIKRLAVSPRVEGADGAGDKITTSGPKIKKKPWRLQMQPKQTPKNKSSDQMSCSPLKNLEDQISEMLKAIRYSSQSSIEKEIPQDHVDGDSSSVPITRTRKHRRQKRKAPYQKSRPVKAEDKDPAKNNPMITSLPTVTSPVNNILGQGTSDKKILVPKITLTVPAAADIGLPTKDRSSRNSDKARSGKRKQKGSNNSNKKRKAAHEFEDEVIEGLTSQFAQLAI